MRNLEAQVAIEIEQLGVALGAQVHGIDLRTPVQEDVAEQLRAALATHQVLVFRGQNGISTEQHIRAAEIWGFPGGSEELGFVELNMGTTYSYRSKMQFFNQSLDTPSDGRIQDGFGLWDARAALELNAVSVTIAMFGQNLANIGVSVKYAF